MSLTQDPSKSLIDFHWVSRSLKHVWTLLSPHTHTHRCDVTRLESIFGKSSYWKNSSCRSVCVCVCKSAIVLCFNVPVKGLNSIKKRVLGVLPSLHSMAVAMVASLMVWRCLMVWWGKSDLQKGQSTYDTKHVCMSVNCMSPIGFLSHLSSFFPLSI